MPRKSPATKRSNGIRVAVLLSSGKDSMLALQKAQEVGHHVVCILSIKSRNPDSWMFHTPNIALVALQAEALGLPFIIQETSGEKERELDDLKQLIVRAKEQYAIEGVVSGAIHSQYQWKRIDKICGDLELLSIAPLWNAAQDDILEEIAARNYVVIVVSIACEGLGERWLGRTIDRTALAELKKLHATIGINVAGEGGEYESLVLDNPLMNKRIAIKKSKKIMENENTGRLLIERAELVAKGNKGTSLTRH